MKINYLIGFQSEYEEIFLEKLNSKIENLYRKELSLFPFVNIFLTKQKWCISLINTRPILRVPLKIENSFIFPGNNPQPAIPVPYITLFGRRSGYGVQSSSRSKNLVRKERLVSHARL